MGANRQIKFVSRSECGATHRVSHAADKEVISWFVLTQSVEHQSHVNIYVEIKLKNGIGRIWERFVSVRFEIESIFQRPNVCIAYSEVPFEKGNLSQCKYYRSLH